MEKYYSSTEGRELNLTQKEDSFHRRDKTFQGTIIDVKYDVRQLSCCISGIKRSEASDYTPSSGFFGGNGTYRVGYPETSRELLLIVKLNGYPYVKIDVREKALELNERQKITDAFVSNLKDKLKNKVVEIKYAGCMPYGEHQFELTKYAILKL